MALGARIHHYRLALKLTLEALSEKSGVELGTIAALEARDSQRSKFTARIAKALGLTVEQLLDEHRDWLKEPARYSPAPSPECVLARDQADDRLGKLANREVEVIIALRSLSQKRRDQFIAELMQAHEEATQFATEVLARQGAHGRVTDARAAETLPEHPEGTQPDSVPGLLYDR